MTSAAMSRKDDRLSIPSLGEWYSDLIKVDAAINGRSEPNQAHSLLCAKLQERESKIKDRVQYLADKRKISFAEMWNQLLTSRFEKLTPEEFEKLLEDQEGADNEQNQSEE